MTTATRHGDLQQPRRAQSTAKSRIGLIVALSMAAGLIAAVILVAMPFIPATENVLTGVVLLGFALGWALLAVLSTRFSDQPQRWAAAPAMFMAVAGLVSLSGSTAAQTGFSWVWPPVLFGLVVWMFLRIRRDMRSRTGRWLLYPVLAVLMIASVGGGYQTVRESLDAKAYPPPGQLIDVGGHRLHLHCTGSGSPTVVLEPGGGASSSDFAWIAPAVARDTRVCVYDRAGRGWSDPTDGPQDGAHIAADLHTLLQRAQVPGPYVLAGHSFGGLYVQSFAAQFPDQVAGMVLLDSTAPKPGPVQPTNTDPDNVIGRVAALSAASAHLGAGRLLNPLSYTTLPPRSRDEARANSSTARNLASSVEEYAVANTSMQQASALTSLNGKPLIVLTADEGNNDNQWQSKQDHMAKLSTNSLHRHANATHASLLDNEADAAVASQAIHDVVIAVRTSRPLAPR
jgi:pimeloyl-ACP methyl ester carboxylesterase/FtsH-binding integral membrane protein